eukprot:CAMPEP_0119088756 /NCGR_PEP_ID=MMETSP1178-20130426/146620_1 /TAXON_ID=33656 /ORGANISM="unid sp, Strain CCMP2000" /LENGTH=98 /DNA_ID=CAMNT_0007072063 /DNA_START=238 /DNA_END=535 /DNA_ORIENTATION=-
MSRPAPGVGVRSVHGTKVHKSDASSGGHLIGTATFAATTTRKPVAIFAASAREVLVPQEVVLLLMYCSSVSATSLVDTSKTSAFAFAEVANSSDPSIG